MTVPATLTAIGTQIAVGGGLFYAVVKFFDTVGNRLTEDTRLEIAVWLLGIKAVEKIQNWPNTFAKVFDRVFGKKHLSWRCFGRSSLATLAACVLSSLLFYIYFWPPTTLPGQQKPEWGSILVLAVAIAGWLCPFDYVSLLETRFILKLLPSSSPFGVLALLVADVIATGVTGGIPSYLSNLGFTVHPVASYYQRIDDERARADAFKTTLEQIHAHLLISDSSDTEKLLKAVELDKKNLPKRTLFLIMMMWVPTFVTSLWLWLYAGSGLLLKGARRFDIGFQWFNRHFDIEKKPLQSIGLVAGAIVALVYWGAVALAQIL